MFCVGVMYSGEYDVCDVTLSVYPHRASLKNMPGHGGNRTYDLWNTSPMLCQLSYAVRSIGVCDISKLGLVPSISMQSIVIRVAQLAEHWASIPKVVGSIPTVAKYIFQACPVWIYTQSNIMNIKSLYMMLPKLNRPYITVFSTTVPIDSTYKLDQ